MADTVKRQWPDNITSGEIRFDPSGIREGGFVLRDVMHGIPVFGSVSVEVFNYPGQTEAIAKALCDRWNSHAALVETLQWVRANYAGGSTAEINARIDAALTQPGTAL